MVHRHVGNDEALAPAYAGTLKTTGETMNITVVNTGTFLGAVCFFVGAYLLFPPHEPVPDPIEWTPAAT